jgi:isopentenyl diphosphate isomerase/L-lactate dehydrogenase-like FMN-dependent dehydrogenase
MSNEWFEAVAVAQRRAKKRLPKSVHRAVVAGSEKGVTLADNVAAFAELGFAPHVAGLPAERGQGVRVMGQPVSMPVICSPTGVQAVHPDGEVAVARAAASRGTAVGLSSLGSKPVEEAVAANPKTFSLLYWVGGRDQVEARVERARAAGAAGAAGLIVTLDCTFDSARDRGSPKIPEQMNLALGAKAVMIGRAYLWGRQRPGRRGEHAGHPPQRHRLGAARLGKASIRDLTPDDVLVPPGFTMTLGNGPVSDLAHNGQAAPGLEIRSPRERSDA